MDEVRPSLFSQSHLSVSLFSFSHFCNICLDPMEIIIIKEGEGERQIDDEAEEKAINASQKKEEVLRMWEEEMKERAF